MLHNPELRPCTRAVKYEPKSGSEFREAQMNVAIVLHEAEEADFRAEMRALPARQPGRRQGRVSSPICARRSRVGSIPKPS